MPNDNNKFQGGGGGWPVAADDGGSHHECQSPPQSRNISRFQSKGAFRVHLQRCFRSRGTSSEVHSRRKTLDVAAALFPTVLPSSRLNRRSSSCSVCPAVSLKPHKDRFSLSSRRRAEVESEMLSSDLDSSLPLEHRSLPVSYRASGAMVVRSGEDGSVGGVVVWRVAADRVRVRDNEVAASG